VVTTLGVFGFEPRAGGCASEALHPGVSVDTVRANTGFEIAVADTLTTTALPTEQELGILRMLDPARQFIG